MSLRKSSLPDATEVVEQLVDQLADPAAHRADPLLPERVVGELAQPGVGRRVGDHHPVADGLQHRPVLGAPLLGQHAEQRADPVPGQPGIGVGGHHVVVAGQQPGLVGLGPVHGVRGAQPGEVGVGVLGELLGRAGPGPRRCSSQVSFLGQQGG